MKALHWSTRLELVLAEPSALRVLDTASIIQLARNVRQDISKPSVERWIQEAVAANRLRRVVRGLFLNRLITPPAQLCEAAVWLRPGAVISLQTVLGDFKIYSTARHRVGNDFHVHDLHRGDHRFDRHAPDRGAVGRPTSL